MSLATLATGIELRIEIATVMTPIAELTNITPPALSRNEIETTTHNDMQESFLAGLLRKGPVTLAINWLPADPTHSALLNAILNNTPTDFEIQWPNAGPLWSYSAYVMNFGPGGGTPDIALTADITLRLRGNITLA